MRTCASWDCHHRVADNKTALHYAAMNGKWRTCRLLCESGCDIDAKDDTGRTASMWAIERNFLRCAATIAERVHFGTR